MRASFIAFASTCTPSGFCGYTCAFFVPLRLLHQHVIIVMTIASTKAQIPSATDTTIKPRFQRRMPSLSPSSSSTCLLEDVVLAAFGSFFGRVVLAPVRRDACTLSSCDKRKLSLLHSPATLARASYGHGSASAYHKSGKQLKRVEVYRTGQ